MQTLYNIYILLYLGCNQLICVCVNGNIAGQLVSPSELEQVKVEVVHAGQRLNDEVHLIEKLLNKV